jgi:flagellin
MSATMERLSTGIRINSAKDDAAGLAISSKMTSQVNGLNQAVRNANDAISMIQVAAGAMGGITDMLQRMRELAVQAISDSNTTSDRAALDNEFDELKLEINRIAADTQWNGTALLTSGAEKKFQIGANAGQTVSITIGDFSAKGSITASNVLQTLTDDADMTDSDEAFLGNSASVGLEITDATKAGKALYALSDAINNVDAERASLGASMSRLEYASVISKPTDAELPRKASSESVMSASSVRVCKTLEAVIEPFAEKSPMVIETV